MTLPAELATAVRRARSRSGPISFGRVDRVVGVAIEATGLAVAIGELCTVQSAAGALPCEVVGFDGSTAILLPLGDARGVAPADRVVGEGRPLGVRVSPACLGRVVDGLGRPLDGGPPLIGRERDVTAAAPPALARAPIEQVMPTGVAAIDAFCTLGRGQRIGVFSSAGVGKSTLLGSIARGAPAADVNVIALVGERGREVREFVDDVLGPDGMARSVVVVATSDTPPLVRYKAPFVAVAIAEAFREAGSHVLFALDSVTRFAAAAREIGLAAGEPPGLRGYPPSLFAALPKLVERLGTDAHGSITGLLTVLVEGDDHDEPVADALRGYLDGHVVLSRELAARGRYPAIDVGASLSRLMTRVATAEHQADARAVRALLAAWEDGRDLVQVGAYRKGADPQLDRAVACRPAIDELLYHGGAFQPFDATLRQLAALAQGRGAAAPPST